MIPTFITQKKFYIPALAVLALIGYSSVRSYQKAHAPVEYETVKVTRGDLDQTIEATGKLESANDVALRFEIAGTIATIAVHEGQAVTTGTLLASLKATELNAAVAQASANLQQKLAGATTQDRAYYEAALTSAKASYDQSQVDAVTTVKTAESALETARNNLKLASGGDQSQIVSQAYEDAAALTMSSLAKLDDALTQADNILGVDNKLANESFVSYLSGLDPGKKILAENAYSRTKLSLTLARSLGSNIGTGSPHTQIDTALSATEKALSDSTQLLAAVSAMLDATVPNANFTQTTLDGKKTTIATTRATITTQYTASINQRQTIADAKNSFTTYSIAAQKAERDLVDARAEAAANVKIKEAAYLQALANLQGKIEPPREVDVAGYRAALAQALANRDKTILRAPSNGTVAKINKKRGELVTPSDVMVQMISPHYQIKVDVPETDIVKLTNDTGNQVTFTLDAYGSDIKFTGQVVAIDRKSTEIQDVVYYQITISVFSGYEEKNLKTGMTANVKIQTNHRGGVLYLPQRVVRSRDDGTKFVRVLENGQEKEAPIKLGLRADEGRVEIIEGVSENQEVIVAVKNAQ